MSKNFKDWFSILITGIFLFVLAWKYFGFDVAKTLLSMSNYLPLIITGAIALILGLNRSKWSGLFGVVALVLYITSFK